MRVGGCETLNEVCICGDVLNWFSLKIDKGKDRMLL